jgi:adenylate kinase
MLFGPPGAGKGTYAEMLRKEFGWNHLNMGQIIREEIKNETKIGLHAKKVIDAGELVGDNVINEIAKNYVINTTGEGNLYDGFPRTVAQAKMIDQLLNARRQRLDFLIYLDCSLPVITDRIVGRGRDENDNKERAIHRFKVYERETKPVLDYFENKDKVIAINGDGTIDEVYSKIKELL